MTRLPPGFKVGHWSDAVALTGCTVILCPPATVGGCDVRGSSPGTRETALSLARLAQDAEISGIVASAEDTSAIRAACDSQLLIVTPGIRGAKAVAGDDQKRIVAPRQAVGRGADYLVVGRPIRQAADPAGEADAIVGEIAEGLSLRGRG